MIKRPAKLEYLSFFVEEAGRLAEEAGLPPSEIGRIELCVEEVVVNIMNYAFPDGVGSLRMECACDKDVFTVTVWDKGIPFDMSQREDPDITSNAEDRAVGGLGVFLVKELMDEVVYKRENGTNILTLKKIINSKNP